MAMYKNKGFGMHEDKQHNESNSDKCLHLTIDTVSVLDELEPLPIQVCSLLTIFNLLLKSKTGICWILTVTSASFYQLTSNFEMYKALDAKINWTVILWTTMKQYLKNTTFL